MSPEWVWNPHILLLNGHRNSFLGDKADWEWSRSLIAITVSIKNASTYTSIFPARLYSVVTNNSQVQLYFFFNFITARFHGVTARSGLGHRDGRDFTILLRHAIISRAPLDQ